MDPRQTGLAPSFLSTRFAFWLWQSCQLLRTGLICALATGPTSTAPSQLQRTAPFWVAFGSRSRMAFTDKRRTFARLLPPLLRAREWKMRVLGGVKQVAEREGFEPSVQVLARTTV